MKIVGANWNPAFCTAASNCSECGHAMPSLGCCNQLAIRQGMGITSKKGLDLDHRQFATVFEHVCAVQAFEFESCFVELL
jgi:hypothetical protein